MGCEEWGLLLGSEDATGNQKLKPRKHLYGQAFGLYALSEYYVVSKKKEALDLATRLFNVLESKSHDKDRMQATLSSSTKTGRPHRQRDALHGRRHCSARAHEHALAFVGGDDDVLSCEERHRHERGFWSSSTSRATPWVREGLGSLHRQI